MATVTCFYGDTIPPGYSVHTVYVVAVLKLNIDLRKTRRTHKKKHSLLGIMFRLAQPRRYTRGKKISTDISSRKLIMLTKHKSLQICLLTLELPKTGIIGYWHAPCLHEYKGFCFAFLNQFFGSRIFSRCLFSLRGICQEYLTNSQKKPGQI